MEFKKAVAGSVLLYPNPVKSTVTLRLPSPTEKVTVTVSAMTGGKLFTRTGQVTDLNLFLNKELGTMKPGLYVFEVNSMTEHYVFKFIRQ